MKKTQAFVEGKVGLSAPRSIDVALDIGEITYDYPLPSGYVFVTVLLEEQLIEVEHSQGNWLALFFSGRNVSASTTTVSASTATGRV